MKVNRQVLIIGSCNGLALKLGRKLEKKGFTNISFLVYNADPWIPTINSLNYRIEDGSILDVGFLSQLIRTETVVYHMGSINYLLDYEASRVTDYNIKGVRNVVDICLENKVESMIYLGSLFGMTDSEEYHLQFQNDIHMANLEIIRGLREGLNAHVIFAGVIRNHSKSSIPHHYRGKIYSSSEDEVLQSLLEKKNLKQLNTIWNDLDVKYLESDIPTVGNHSFTLKVINRIKYKNSHKAADLFFDSDFQANTYSDNIP